MTVRWGSIEIPELTYRTRLISQLHEPHDPQNPFGLRHHPTGLHMEATSPREERRGDGMDYLLFGPDEEGWTLRMRLRTVRSHPSLRTPPYFGLRKEDFYALGSQDQETKEIEFLQLHGAAHECLDVCAEGASPPALWTAERRDALALMVCFLQERFVYFCNPLPSKVDMTDAGIPEAFRGIVRNPILDRQA